jgi:hypothetical protein
MIQNNRIDCRFSKPENYKKKICESLVVKRSYTAALWNTIKSATNISRIKE